MEAEQTKQEKKGAFYLLTIYLFHFFVDVQVVCIS